MRAKDSVVSWFVRNIVLQKVERIDKPGFITITTTTGKESVNIRELFMPEGLLAGLENEISKKSKAGDLLLYSCGKRFGYAYSTLSDFPTVRGGRRQFLSFVYFLVRWVESTYAGNISHSIDYENRVFRISMDNYVVCRENGKGWLLGPGGIAGIWAYMACDDTVEAVQTKCQGRGDPRCEIVAAPYDSLAAEGLKPFRTGKMEPLKLDREYLETNQTRPTRWASHSLRSLIDSGFFKYSRGQVTFKSERFFLCEASLMYVLEKELAKLSGGLKTLFDVSFGFGREIARLSGSKDPARFIGDLFPALGFGDILVEKRPWKVMVNCFPWTKWADDISFAMFRGMLSGVITEMAGEKVILKKTRKYRSGDGFSLVLGR